MEVNICSFVASCCFWPHGCSRNDCLRERYCVLHGSVIEYYKSKKDSVEGKLQGRIDLSGASSQLESDDDGWTGGG